MLRGFLGFLLLYSLCAGPTLAQEREEALEEWQQRILDAIERDGDSRRGAGSEAYRRSAPDDAAAAAAEQARREYGGRVLAVGRVGSGYRVRLLLDSGRVITVEVAE